MREAVGPVRSAERRPSDGGRWARGSVDRGGRSDGIGQPRRIDPRLLVGRRVHGVVVVVPSGLGVRLVVLGRGVAAVMLGRDVMLVMLDGRVMFGRSMVVVMLDGRVVVVMLDGRMVVVMLGRGVVLGRSMVVVMLGCGVMLVALGRRVMLVRAAGEHLARPVVVVPELLVPRDVQARPELDPQQPHQRRDGGQRRVSQQGPRTSAQAMGGQRGTHGLGLVTSIGGPRRPDNDQFLGTAQGMRSDRCTGAAREPARAEVGFDRTQLTPAHAPAADEP